MYRKDVSNIEISRMMGPIIDELMKDVTPRVIIEKKEPESKAGAASKDSKSGSISKDEKLLLDSIYEKPNLSITGRSSSLGLSASKMNSLKKGLIKKGLVEEFSVNLGKKHGGVVKMLAITEPGFGFIKKRPRMRKPENVSYEHWWWQQIIFRNYDGHDIKAEIEKTLNSKRADVGIVWNGREIAIEVELSPKNAVSNIVEDLKAGFYKVATYCKNSTVQKEVKKRLQIYDDYDKIKDRVEVRLLADIEILSDLE